MATVNDLLLDSFGRITEDVADTLDQLDDEQLHTVIEPGANTVAWLVWHLTRVLDDHVAGAFGDQQVWLRDGWCERFGLPFEPQDHGYGQSFEQVQQVTTGGDLLRDYFTAVQEYVADRVRSVTESDLDRVVDRNWEPPVTLAVRLVSVVNDAAQHAGQAAYAAGILRRR